METPKKFRASLFGYKKKNVNAYIMENATRFEKEKKELEEKNSELEKEKRELEEKNSRLSEKVSILEKERSYIADALLNASQEAEKILSSAKTEAAKIRSELEIELEGLNGEIAREKNRISEIRNDAKKALGEYISRLDSIDMDNEPEDAVSDTSPEAVSAPEREFEPIISDGDDLLEDIEAINTPCEDILPCEDDTQEDEDENEIEEVYSIEDDDDADFEIENIEA